MRRGTLLLATFAGAAIVAAAGAAAFVWSGVYDISATAQHAQPTFELLELAGRQSIRRHAAGMVAPRLDDPARVARGALCYRDKCQVCHGGPGVAQGDVLFNQVGCASCHTPVQHTSSSAATHLRDLEIRPYTDMKVWNVNGGSFRTAPLWGLAHNIDLLTRNGRAIRFMHDGSATSVDAAIQKHDGSAASSRTQYNALSATDRANIVKFVESL